MAKRGPKPKDNRQLHVHVSRVVKEALDKAAKDSELSHGEIVERALTAELRSIIAELLEPYFREQGQRLGGRRPAVQKLLKALSELKARGTND